MTVTHSPAIELAILKGKLSGGLKASGGADRMASLLPALPSPVARVGESGGDGTSSRGDDTL